MKQRVITAVLLILLVVPCVIIGSYPFYLLAMAFICLASYEIMRLFDQKWPKWAVYSIYLFFLLTVVLAIIDPLKARYGVINYTTDQILHYLTLGVYFI